MSGTGKRTGVVISVKRVTESAGLPLERPYLSFKLHGTPQEGVTDVPVLDEIKFDPSLVNENLRKFAEWHGWEQRLRDAAAKPCDKKTGKSASPQEKFAAIRRLAEHYLNGAESWNLKTGPGVGGAVSDDKQMLKAALAEYLPSVGKERTAEQIHEAVEGMKKPEISALLANAKIAAIVLRLREEKAAEMEVDGDELLEGI